jgi:VWFA-related protein
MAVRQLRVGLMVGLVVGLAGAAPRTQAPLFRSTTETVPVYVTVTGVDGRLVTTLQRDDFRVLDEGRPQPITLFANDRQPINIVVMLDMSGSMAGNLGVLRSAAVELFTRLLPDDRARVGSFGEQIVISRQFTNDVDELIRALWIDLRPGGHTPIWQAIGRAMYELSRLEGRRVVLVLSDGQSTRPERGFTRPDRESMEDVVARAEREDFMIYAIGMYSRPARARSLPRAPGSWRGRPEDAPDPALHEIASRTGGGYFVLDQIGDLAGTFTQVTEELHRQYLIGFVPPQADGRLHAIEVELREPDMIARARRTYLAPTRGSR